MEDDLLKKSILRVGEVSGIEGRRVFIKVDKDKNSSDLLFDGDVIKNVSVGAYIEIKKGFISIIGKIDGERLKEDLAERSSSEYKQLNKNDRSLSVSLVGYIGFNGRFVGGIKELPLIGNEAFILTEQKIHSIHNLVKRDCSLKICIAKTDVEEISISLPVDGIFNSHIAIFGNTGSGKSNTLAALYQGLFIACEGRQTFTENSRFLFFDFNGEYVKGNCLTRKKKVYSLKTQDDTGDKLPLSSEDFFDNETLSILVEATDKTQKPFLKRALRKFKNAKSKDQFAAYLRAILLSKIKSILKMANKDTANKLLDYMQEALFLFVDDGQEVDLSADIEFHSVSQTFKKLGAEIYFNSRPDAIEETDIYRFAFAVEDSKINNLPELTQFYIFLHIQLIEDLLTYKVQNDHIYPVVNRFKAKQTSITRTFNVTGAPNFWQDTNCVVINLHDVNLDMKKTIPLLLAKSLYDAHKKEDNQKSLNVIIDEAHNILSKTSFRETEDWKDYRLETFEEIIKEGRKFGVFLTISSQRPNDISETIISQAHNYFIHQLINERDLLTIGNAVSYIDKITEEAIPTLPVGTCVFSGIATPMPLKIRVDELPEANKPDSRTLKFEDIVGGEAVEEF
jgi:hypothetical protein